MGRLDGKVALISGGSRGMGAEEARLFAEEGAKVVFGDVLDEEGKQVEAEIRGSGGEATYVHLDVTRESDWRAAVETAVKGYGKLDVLVNNAAIVIHKGIEDTTEEEWDRLMAINLKGTFLGTKCAIPAMRQAGGGSIMNISSQGGLRGSADGFGAYTASKGAVRLFAKATAMEYAKDNIRCNSVYPGPTETATIQETLDDPARNAVMLQWIPMRRRGIPRDIAYGVLYLASDESSWVTGSELVIDGGLTAK